MLQKLIAGILKFLIFRLFLGGQSSILTIFDKNSEFDPQNIQYWGCLIFGKIPALLLIKELVIKNFVFILLAQEAY